MHYIEKGIEVCDIREFTRKINGKLERDVVMLLYPRGLRIGKALHKIGLDYCINQNGGSVPMGGLSFGKLMTSITPEMLKPYGITMLWPNRIAMSTDNDPPIVSPHEAEMYEEMNEKLRIDKDNYAKNMSEVSEQFARRLETQRTHGHPVISTWAPDIISVKAIKWAGQYVNGDEPDLAKFFEKKLQEAKRHSNKKERSPVDAGTTDGGLEE